MDDEVSVFVTLRLNLLMPRGSAASREYRGSDTSRTGTEVSELIGDAVLSYLSDHWEEFMATLPGDVSAGDPAMVLEGADLETDLLEDGYDDEY